MCATELRLIDAFHFAARRGYTSRARIVRFALIIHRDNCSDCAPVVVTTNFPKLPRQKTDGLLTWKSTGKPGRRGR